MLLIPAAVKKLKDEGRKETLKRQREAAKKFGVEVDGVTMLPMTPEVQEFMQAEPGATESEQAE